MITTITAKACWRLRQPAWLRVNYVIWFERQLNPELPSSKCCHFDTSVICITLRSIVLLLMYNSINLHLLNCTVLYCTLYAQYSIVQCSAVQYSTVQYSTVQYSTVQYSTVQYSTALFTWQSPGIHSPLRS